MPGYRLSAIGYRLFSHQTFMRGAHTAAMNMVADARLSAIGYRLFSHQTFMRGAHTAAMNMVADARLSAIGYWLSAIFTSDVHARGAHRRDEHGR